MPSGCRVPHRGHNDDSGDMYTYRVNGYGTFRYKPTVRGKITRNFATSDLAVFTYSRLEANDNRMTQFDGYSSTFKHLLPSE